MATSIGGILANLRANAGEWISGMKNAKKSTFDFLGSVKDIKAEISGIKGAIAGGAAAIGLTAAAYKSVAMVSQEMEAIDSNAKLADRLGVDTEALVGLQHAAGLAGVGVEEFGGDFEKMWKNIGNAAGGDKAAQEAFSAIGLDAKELAGMGADQAFLKIADAIARVPNSAQRAAATTDIFGKSGQALMNTLTQGSDAIREQIDEAQKLGIAYSRVDAAKVEAANDAITRAQEAFRGTFTQAAAAVAPFVEAGANAFKEWAIAGEGAGGRVRDVMEFIAGGAAIVADEVDLIRTGFKWSQAAVLAFGAAAADAFASVADMASKLPERFGGGLAKDLGEGSREIAKVMREDSQIIQDEIAKTFTDKTMGERVKGFFDKMQRDATAAGQKAAQAIKESNKNGFAIPKPDFTAQLKAWAEFAKEAKKLSLEAFPVEKSKSEMVKYTAMLLTGQMGIAAFAALVKKSTKEIEDADPWASFAKSTYASTRTDAEVAKHDIGELNRALKAGKIDWQTYQRAARDALQAAMPDTAAMRGIEEGSSEAAAMLIQRTEQARMMRAMKDNFGVIGEKPAWIDAAKDAQRKAKLEQNTLVDDSVAKLQNFRIPDVDTQWVGSLKKGFVEAGKGFIESIGNPTTYLYNGGNWLKPPSSAADDFTSSGGGFGEENISPVIDGGGDFGDDMAATAEESKKQTQLLQKIARGVYWDGSHDTFQRVRFDG